ncbi:MULTISPECIES: tRNA (adenosine(37)-N6)-threonylcarbamoyltransferase complex ATPase subunit type 1 TsaE [unclassified Ruegeria]|uniref:tRNA (adenosine(37)-N6)-threonylcarbamoyltransferase complex ATPase subunit type 1 TsaE n=1 Tax=unclassified Ruegeria TaxID=2625375 RepID=UPI001488871E|nr:MULTISPECIES: tRNA (adenosine(37)-N6)-threonylcarbamoyltransferase complex ATPase subunit type 1 TsaE [unclassified Ruegeria]
MTAPKTILLNSPEDTSDLALQIGQFLKPGDTLLLEGPIGSGKTHFARALIQSLMVTPEDVPSPTFTLVQVYDTPLGEVWHSDLYRLSSPEETEELGLIDAFETSICLIEWPEKLGDSTPNSALTLSFRSDTKAEDIRHLNLKWTDPKWARKLEFIP